MNIKIYEDDIKMANRISEKLEIYFKKLSYSYQINITSSNYLVDYLQNKGDIIFLDINLGEINGIELAEIIKNDNSQVIIIFISSLNELVFDSFIVQPFNFIRKVHFDSDMERCLPKLTKYMMNNYKLVHFKSKGRHISVKIKDIVYVESFLHDIVIHTINNSYKSSGPLIDFIQNLNSLNIVRIQKSYAINMVWIKEVHKDSVLLKNNKQLSIGGMFKSNFLELYNNFLMK